MPIDPPTDVILEFLLETCINEFQSIFGFGQRAYGDKVSEPLWKRRDGIMGKEKGERILG